MSIVAHLLADALTQGGRERAIQTYLRRRNISASDVDPEVLVKYGNDRWRDFITEQEQWALDNFNSLFDAEE